MKFLAIVSPSSIYQRQCSSVRTASCLLFHYHLKNHKATRLLPSTNLTPPRILVVSQATTRGLFAPIFYRRSAGDNTLTMDGYITRLMVLQGNPTPPTPGLTPVPDYQVNTLTATIVTHVLYSPSYSATIPNIAHTSIWEGP